MSEPVVYEAQVYARHITYKNFKGETKTTEVYFALDPLELMRVIGEFEPKKSKSNNPVKKDSSEITSEQQLAMLRDLACRAAGTPSDDGEFWDPFERFEETILGKAFLAKLMSSDGDRREFADKVILEPFRAFMSYAIADPSNSQADVAEFRKMLLQMETMFREQGSPDETFEQKRARLAAEMAALDASND